MKHFQYTQSIGFRLRGDIAPLSVKGGDDDGLLQDFLRQYEKLLDLYLDALFFERKDGNLYLSNFITVKYPFLKLHAKERYFAPDFNREKTKIYTKDDAHFLEDVLWDWHERNTELYDQLVDEIMRPQNKQVKRADLLYLLKQFFSADNLFFLRDLLQNINHKRESGKINALQAQAQAIEKTTERCLALLSPDQKKGIEVARGSFNYFTVNKQAKDFGGILKELEEKKMSPYKKQNIKELNLLKAVGFCVYIKKKYGTDNPYNLSLSDLYDALKDFKAEQKSKFLEQISQEKWMTFTVTEKEDGAVATTNSKPLKMENLKGKTFHGFAALGAAVGLNPPKRKPKNLTPEQEQERFAQWVHSEFPLFFVKKKKDKNVLSDFLAITREIKDLGEKNQAASPIQKQEITKQLRDKRIKRGKYFQQKWGFAKYEEYCDLYKQVAMTLGKIKAEIKAIEREKIEARLLKYWGLLIDRGETKQIMLVPKAARQEVKRYLQSGKGEIAVLENSSITLRALEKLVRQNFPKQIPDFNEDELLLVKKCKAVLQGRVPQIKLDISAFRDDVLALCEQNHHNKEEFRRDLETVAYRWQCHHCSEADLQQLQKQFGVLIFTLSAYDFERKLQSPEKAHTKLWQEFWSKDNQNLYPLRINPEFRIFYRDTVEQNDADGKKANNRFSHPEARIQFSFTRNAGKAEMQNAFAGEQDLQEQINLFNQAVVDPWVRERDAEENLWYYGIDRGNQELATLGVVRWAKEKYEAMLADGNTKPFDKPEFADISVLKIRDTGATKTITVDRSGTQKEVKIVDNPSYFMADDSEIARYFEEKTVSFIDLTTAKLIKGKIVLDGDVKTYLALKEANAKRKLFEVLSEIKKDANIRHDGKKITIQKKDDKHETLCFFDNRQIQNFGESAKQSLICRNF